MNDSEAHQEHPQDSDKLNVPIWLRATLEDAKDLDFEAPLTGSISADCHELSDLYRASCQRGDESAPQDETASNRVMTMLSSIAGLHLKPNERNEPFGPMVIFADGRRSAITSDFRAHVELLADLAVRAKNCVLRARLSDVCWLLERKRGTLAAAAISAYVEIVEKTERGELKYRFATEGGALTSGACDYLRRALQIGRAIGWDKPETVSARELVRRIREQAIAARALVPIHWFCDLDLDFAISDPAAIGEAIEGMLLQPLPDEASPHIVVDLWKLAARAFHIARRESDKNRCLSEAAEKLVAVSQETKGSAMLAAHFLSSAIAQLHGLPGKKDRRTELRQRLIDLQAQVPEEMSVFSQELDLREIEEIAQEIVGQADLFDMLFIFADLEKSPDPKKLADDAVETIQQHPISSLFGAAHLDRFGKVIARTQSAGIGEGSARSAAFHRIVQAEEIRRKIVAFGMIEPARRLIAEQHYLCDDTFAWLLQHSPFVPSDLIATFARGFLRFFQGDFVSAVYILTPQLENSLRHILKGNGYDLTIFDDATQTQQDRTISSLFEQMRTELEGVLTTEIAGDIERLFLNKPGPHLRHAVAHGLMHDGDPYGSDAIYACWLIFRLCLLPLFPYSKELKSTEAAMLFGLSTSHPKP
ncbi:hypothetical protein PbB2_01982 [Candidatus Phycosocius bacilliformis]|uniref:DUF7380 domain-containing protein n=1 Tax=Candidatus Phycosocius bacilliformis TaxID=1445552 RepID=A0A2P2EB55_9PROT|nr:DUF4209 domain-containing protein [Candidatus Phycosocius bacilliformis]GBF58308.1 hypothetical protein PbB2_01982 [Candidatus Phycosocius bacilliformis]